MAIARQLELRREVNETTARLNGATDKVRAEMRAVRTNMRACWRSRAPSAQRAISLLGRTRSRLRGGPRCCTELSA
jgi:hypothetical protein